MPMISSTSDRRRLAQLHVEVRKRDAALTVARDALATAESNRGALQARLDATLSKRPPTRDDETDAAAATLAANPTMDIGTTLLDRLVGGRRKRDDGQTKWNATVQTLRAAIRKVETSIAERRCEIEALEAERAKAWARLVAYARPAFVEELRRRAKVLNSEVLLPMIALANAVKAIPPQVLYDASQGVDEGDGYLSEDSKLELILHDMSKSVPTRTRLCPPPDKQLQHPITKATYPEEVDPAPFLNAFWRELDGERG